MSKRGGGWGLPIPRRPVVRPAGEAALTLTTDIVAAHLGPGPNFSVPVPCSEELDPADQGDCCCDVLGGERVVSPDAAEQECSAELLSDRDRVWIQVRANQSVLIVSGACGVPCPL
jgi:hypothetical protein